MATINGNAVPEADGMTVAAYLEQEQIQSGSVAVERNQEIVPKSDYSTTVLQAEDTVEIVTFMGGGC